MFAIGPVTRKLSAFAMALTIATPALACNVDGRHQDIYSAFLQKQRNFVEPAPRITSTIPFTSEAGTPSILADYAGKPTIVTFWFPGCPECKKDLPELNAMLDKFGNRDDINFVQISIRGSKSDVARFLGRKSYRNIDMHIDTKSKLFIDSCLVGTPSHLLINRDGKVIETLFGAFRWTDESVTQMLESFAAS